MKTAFPAMQFTDSVLMLAERMHVRAGSKHHIASPLGAWLLLALGSTAAEGAERIACERALGMDRDAAATWARRLLETPHPAVASALAVWVRTELRTAAIDTWSASLGNRVETGQLPSQAEADEWTRRVSLGLIEHFPLRVNDFDVVLSAGLATRCRWVDHYEHAPGRDLVDPGDESGSTWGASLRRVLCSVDRRASSIVRTEEAGDVIVHSRVTREGLRLTSVRAMPEVAPGRVLAAAYAIATAKEFELAVEKVSPFDLPLGAHPLWEITETTMTTPGREEMYDARLPCWEVTTSHDLTASEIGLDAIRASIRRLLGLPMIRVQFVQAATARYSRTGFDAAAVSAGGMARCMMDLSEEGLRRTATLRFNRPYAVVAVVSGGSGKVVDESDPTPQMLWHGVPVFAAWVAEPAESRDDDFDWESEMEDAAIEPAGDDRPAGVMVRFRTKSGRLVELDLEREIYVLRTEEAGSIVSRLQGMIASMVGWLVGGFRERPNRR